MAAAAFTAGCRGGDGPSRDGPPTVRQTTARIRGFDPAHAADMASVTAVGKVYEGLLQYAYWERPYRVEPLLADGMPEVSEDGRVWRFRIREGIRFADDPCFEATGGKGRELTAQDFVYSILRIADIKVGSGGILGFPGADSGFGRVPRSQPGRGAHGVWPSH